MSSPLQSLLAFLRRFRYNLPIDRFIVSKIKGVVGMCKNKKKVRQFLELASAIFGLLAAIMYFQEIRKELDNEG